MSRTAARVTGAGELSPLSPLSLDEAAAVLLRGLVKASTLRAAADRGELTVERLGRRIVTTPAAIEAWRERCRDQPKARDCISGRRGAPAVSPNGLSETDEAKLALAAAMATAEALSKGSLPISPKNIARPAASVHSLKPRSAT